MDYRWDDAVAAGLWSDLDRLVYLSSLVGSEPALAGAGGGNSSIKLADKDFTGRDVQALWVKARGRDLRLIDRAGFTALRLDDVRLLARQEQMSDVAMMDFLEHCRLDPGMPSPTVETPIHALLPFPVVLHTHDLVTQALTDTSKKDALVREALGEEVAYLGYVRSGFPMVKALAGLPDLSRLRGLVLGKRGLVTWGETPKACYDNLHRLVTRMEERIARARATKDPLARARYPAEARPETAREILPLLRGALSRHGRVILHLDASPEARRFVDSELCKQVHRRGMANPENILRCGRVPMYVDDDLPALDPAGRAEALKKAVDQFEADYRVSFAKHGRGQAMFGPSPRIALVPGVGIVGAGPNRLSAEVSVSNYRQVIQVVQAAECLDQFRFLDEASAFEFEYWPLAVADGRREEPEFARRIALVTGAAGGIGFAVARRLALAGAHVVLTDLDPESVRAAADAIAGETRDPHRATAVAADASNEADAARAFDAAVRAYGGVDVVFCNAGYVQVSPITETGLDVWERTIATNLTGAFLAVREAVRVMKAQGFGNIVINASKAAYAPTAHNAPYAASKAAAAHLARCLAVELAPAGIRVNYVNADFIDTPLMRRVIAERAAQRGVTLEAQIEEYRKRNLLKVGPLPPDAVADAVLFLASDRAAYTTGSVVTVDGGLADAMPR